MRMDSTIAMTMPSSTPKNTTPAVATSESTTDDFRTCEVAAQHLNVHQRQRRGDHHRRERGLGQIREQRVQEQQQDDDQAGADHAGELALGPRLFGDRGS